MLPPWWLDNKKLDFPRGYHIDFGAAWVPTLVQVLM